MLLLVRPSLPLRLLLELGPVLFSRLTGLGKADYTTRVLGIRTSGMLRSVPSSAGCRKCEEKNIPAQVLTGQGYSVFI